MIAAVRLTIPRMIDAEFTALARFTSPSSMEVYGTPRADTGPNIRIRQGSADLQGERQKPVKQNCQDCGNRKSCPQYLRDTARLLSCHM